MLDSESKEMKEVCAFFGLAMYSAQCLERTLAMCIAVSETSSRFTVWDYDDHLAGNFDSTFGRLVKTFSELFKSIDVSLVVELEKAVEERNKLVHHYFWDRAVQITSNIGRNQMLRELRYLIGHFDSIDMKLSEQTHRFMQERGVTQDDVDAALEKMLSGVEVPHDPQQIREAVTITKAYEWKIEDRVECGIIFASDIGNLVLGKMGLCLGPQTILKDQLHPKSEFEKALPATIKPKPKNANPWNYELELGNGYELRVRPGELNGKQIIRFGLHKKLR